MKKLLALFVFIGLTATGVSAQNLQQVAEIEQINSNNTVELNQVDSGMDPGNGIDVTAFINQNGGDLVRINQTQLSVARAEVDIDQTSGQNVVAGLRGNALGSLSGAPNRAAIQRGGGVSLFADQSGSSELYVRQGGFASRIYLSQSQGSVAKILQTATARVEGLTGGARADVRGTLNVVQSSQGAQLSLLQQDASGVINVEQLGASDNTAMVQQFGGLGNTVNLSQSGLSGLSATIMQNGGSNVANVTQSID